MSFSSKMTAPGENAPATVLSIGLLFLVCAEVAHALSFSETFASVWIPSGLSLAVYHYFPVKKWHVVLAGAVAGNLVSDAVFHDKTVLVSLGFCVANSVEAMVGAVILHKATKGRFLFFEQAHVAWFLALVCTIGPACGATIGAWVVATAFGAEYADVWKIWWKGDAVGTLVMFPVSWYFLTERIQFKVYLRNWPRVAEILALLAAQGFTVYYIFGLQHQRIAYVSFVFLILLVVRHRSLGTVLGILLTTVICGLLTADGMGLFGEIQVLEERAGVFHIFIYVLSATSLLVNAIVLRGVDTTDQLRRMRFAMDGSSEAIYFVRQDSSFFYVNDAACAMLGYSRDQLMRLGVVDIDPTYSRKVWKEHWRRMKRDRRVQLETVHVRLDGKKKFVAMNIYYFTFDSEEYIVGVARDETRRKEAEATLKSTLTDLKKSNDDLRRSKERFRTLWQTSQDMLASVSPNDGLVIDCNDRLVETLGYKKEEIVGKKVFELYDSSCHDAAGEAFNEFVATGKVRMKPLLLRTRSGTHIPVLLNVNAVRDEAGKILYSSSSWTDITDISAAHDRLDQANKILESVNARLDDRSEELESSEERFRLAIGAAPNAILLVNEDGAIELVNDKAVEIFGYSEDELVGSSVEALVPEAVRSRHIEYRAMFQKSPEARSMGVGRELSALRKNGQQFPVEVSLVPLRVGGRLLTMSSVIDITERKRHLESLERANSELRRSNSDLDDFAYVASHDLKSPLRGIDNLAKWIYEDTKEILPDEARNDLQTLRRRVSRMEELLDGLLQYSRVGREEENFATVDVGRLVDEIADSLPVPKEFRIAHEGLPTFETKTTPLGTVLRNLISNAVKHRERDDGAVLVRCDKRGAFYHFFVSDDGPGVPTDQFEKVFGLFKTVKRRDEKEASGLGLAIVKKSVEREGGWVKIENNEGGPGVTFTFAWPAVTRGEN